MLIRAEICTPCVRCSYSAALPHSPTRPIVNNLGVDAAELMKSRNGKAPVLVLLCRGNGAKSLCGSRVEILRCAQNDRVGFLAK